ncbi:MAG: PorT family protein [Prevotellaceae bacterium]|nr:PorT family protein [Prevotellaceae bacterium]
MITASTFHIGKTQRTLLATLCCVFLLSTPLAAQVGEPRSDFAIGGNAGWTLNTMNFSPTIKQNYHQAPTFGFTARYISEKYFSSICGVQIEVNFAQLGWKELIEDGSENQYSHHLNYVQLPMLMQMGWGRERRGLKFVFEAGPQIGYCFSTGETRGGGAWDISHRPNNVVYQYDHDIDRRFDYGIAVGLGLELSTAVGHFLLEGRYYYGLADTYDSSKQGYFARSANQTIIAKINYLFDLHRTKNEHIK